MASDKPRGLPGFLRRSLRYQDDDEDVPFQNNNLSPVNFPDGNRNDSVVENGNGVQTKTTTTSRATETIPSESAMAPPSSPPPPTHSPEHHHSNNNNSPMAPSSPIPPSESTEETSTSDHVTGIPMATPAPSPAIHKGIRAPTSSPSTTTTPSKEQNRQSFSTPLGVWHEEPSPPPPALLKKSYKERQFESIIHADVVSMTELRKLCWNGIPHRPLRAMAWKLMLGYVPVNSMRRQTTLDRKRSEYRDAILQHYDVDDDARTLQDQETLRQVLVDVPRTAPNVPLFRHRSIRKLLTRLLYIWACRHPASSYVQGINDLVTPFIVVFLNEHYPNHEILDGKVMELVSDQILDEIEADAYWCLTNLLSGIQDHYTSDQPGVQRMVMRLEELVTRIDADLTAYLHSIGIDFMQFAFKWMNCLLLREFNLRCVERLWDTYISEGDGGFENFHVYVCAAFLCQFSSQLRSMEFDELFGFMQHMPTDDWTDTEIEILLSQAYVLSTLFGGSDAHLSNPNAR